MKLEALCLRVAETAIIFLEEELGYKIPDRLILKAAKKAADPKVLNDILGRDRKQDER